MCPRCALVWDALSGAHTGITTPRKLITIALAEEIDPALAKILADIRDYSARPRKALDLIDKCRMVVALYRDLWQLDGGAADH